MANRTLMRYGARLEREQRAVSVLSVIASGWHGAAVKRRCFMMRRLLTATSFGEESREAAETPAGTVLGSTAELPAGSPPIHGRLRGSGFRRDRMAIPTAARHEDFQRRSHELGYLRTVLQKRSPSELKVFAFSDAHHRYQLRFARRITARCRLNVTATAQMVRSLPRNQTSRSRYEL